MTPTPAPRTCSASSLASSMISPLPSRIWSARRRSSPIGPRPTTTWASRCGTAAHKEKALTELRSSVALDPAAGACYAFLGTVLRDPAICPGHARASSAPSPSCRRRRGLRRSRDHLPRARRSGQGARTIRGRAESAVASTPTPDWDSAIAGAAGGRDREARHAEAHHVLGLLLGRKGVDSSDGRRRIPRGDAAASGFRRGAQQPRARAASRRATTTRASRPFARRCASALTTRMRTPILARRSRRPMRLKRFASWRRALRWHRRRSKASSTWPSPTAPARGCGLPSRSSSCRR